MRWFLVLCLLLAASVLPAGAASPYWLWCAVDGWPARFVVNRIKTTSVLLRPGLKPNYLPRQELIIEGLSDDPLDLRGRDAWIVEGHRFRLCLNQELPEWAGQVDLPSELSIHRGSSP